MLIHNVDPSGGGNGMECIGIQWDSLESIGIHWNSIESNGIHWNSMESIGIQWNSMQFVGNHWDSQGSKQMLVTFFNILYVPGSATESCKLW